MVNGTLSRGNQFMLQKTLMKYLILYTLIYEADNFTTQNSNLVYYFLYYGNAPSNSSLELA